MDHENKMTESHPEVTATCPCGAEVIVEWLEEWGEYNVCSAVCPECERTSTGGNARSGKISDWITRRDLDRANEIYEAQLYDAQQNEWNGLGGSW